MPGTHRTPQERRGGPNAGTEPQEAAYDVHVATDDARERVRCELLTDAARSNRAIARAAGVSHNMVASEREQLAGTADTPTWIRLHELARPSPRACRCTSPIRDRMYLGHWSCRQCSRLITGAA